jgi:hypothetical protein
MLRKTKKDIDRYTDRAIDRQKEKETKRGR